jgi:long-chain acyl-CoA synthetase
MTLTMGLRRSLALDADAEALVSDEARLTRREMVDRVARLAAVLRNLGMQNGDRVAMLAPNGQRYIPFLAFSGVAGSSFPLIRDLLSPK